MTARDRKQQCKDSVYHVGELGDDSTPRMRDIDFTPPHD